MQLGYKAKSIMKENELQYQLHVPTIIVTVIVIVMFDYYYCDKKPERPNIGVTDVHR
jgi:hypothetical protein